MFIDGNKEENANGSAIWLDSPETMQNNNHEPNITSAEFYMRISVHSISAVHCRHFYCRIGECHYTPH